MASIMFQGPLFLKVGGSLGLYSKTLDPPRNNVCTNAYVTCSIPLQLQAACIHLQLTAKAESCLSRDTLSRVGAIAVIVTGLAMSNLAIVAGE